MVLHHPAKQRQPGAHKAILHFKPGTLMQANAQQTIPSAQARRPAHRAGKHLLAAGDAGKLDPVVSDLSGEGQIRFTGILPHRVGEPQVIKHVGHLVAVPGAVRIGVMFRFRDIIEPVPPARLAHALLGLHHHIAEGGKRHIPTDFPPQRFIAFYAGIEEFDQSQTQTALTAQFLDLPGDVDAKHRHHAGFIAVGADDHRHRMLAPGKKGLQHRLREHDIACDGRWPDIQRGGKRPEGLRRDCPQLLSAGLW